MRSLHRATDRGALEEDGFGAQPRRSAQRDRRVNAIAAGLSSAADITRGGPAVLRRPQADRAARGRWSNSTETKNASISTCRMGGSGRASGVVFGSEMGELGISVCGNSHRSRQGNELSQHTTRSGKMRPGGEPKPENSAIYSWNAPTKASWRRLPTVLAYEGNIRHADQHQAAESGLSDAGGNGT